MLNHKQKLPQGSQPTPRELEVLELICQGKSTKQVAALLGVRFKTVAAYRQNLMEKAGVHDAISLFRWALKEGHVRVDAQAAHTGGAVGAAVS
jgi:DNA-binding NarL/FixJ family response regulator